MKTRIFSSTIVPAGGTKISDGVSLADFSSSFAIFYTVTGTGTADLFLYTSADGATFTKYARAIKRSINAGSDIVHFPVLPCDSFKIGAEETGGANAVVLTADIVSRPGQFGDWPIYDGATSAVQTIEYEHHEIHGGSHFFVVGYQDLSINQVLDFTWLMPNTTKRIHWTWEIQTESETLWQVYEAATATNALANSVTPLNNDRNSSATSVTTLKYEVQTNLTAANGDTNVEEATLIESGISGAGKSSGDTARNREIIMKQNTLYCLRATATAAGYINFKMSWYEHTNR